MIKNRHRVIVMKEQIYTYLTHIPKGKVVTYKQIAVYLGSASYARVVGNLLHNNPDEHKYPCYKVVNSKGHLSPHYAFGGIRVQKRKLENDGIEVFDNSVDLEKYKWKEENL